MRIVVPQVALSSVLPSSVATYKPDRYSGPANPVGNPVVPTREMQGQSKSAGARTVHPKLNGTPWSYSYAQVPQDAKPKRRGRRRA